MATTRTPFFYSLLSYQVGSVCDAMRRGAAMRFQREQGLSLAQWRVLALIRTLQPVRLRDVAAYSEADKGQMSRLVSSLVDKGLIRRTAHAGDARSAHLALTESGETVAAALTRSAHERDAALRAAFGPAEAQHFSNLLARLKAAAVALVDEEERLRSRSGET